MAKLHHEDIVAAAVIGNRLGKSIDRGRGKRARSRPAKIADDPDRVTQAKHSGDRLQVVLQERDEACKVGLPLRGVGGN